MKYSQPQRDLEFRTPLIVFRERMRQVRSNLSNALAMADTMYKYTTVREATANSAYEVEDLTDQVLKIERIMFEAVQKMAGEK
jgi:phosphosulfolactate synthase (CoM biosynthesis protein A)